MMEELTLFQDNAKSGAAKFQRGIHLLFGSVFILTGILKSSDVALQVLYLFLGVVAVLNALLMPLSQSRFIRISESGLEVKTSFLAGPKQIFWNEVSCIVISSLALKITTKDNLTERVALGKFSYEQKKHLKSKLQEVTELKKITLE